jgi:hypothetical protein
MAVVRVSILTIPAEHLAEAEQIMVDAEPSLRGILDLPGVISYFAGVDRAKGQLTNVSFWESTEAAEQMSTFQPMLDLAGSLVPLGATFLRPIPNFEMVWQWGDVTPPT